MHKATTELVERIKKTPQAYFVLRSTSRYEQFLDLYQKVGYAPSTPEEVEQWKERSCKTWMLQDHIPPGSCTGGWVEGRVISAAGTLPMAENILYGHSFCMVKTLDAAATLFAQSLNSLNNMGAFPEITYWAGSYAHRARFTSSFQRPPDDLIADQLELEVVRLLQPESTRRYAAPLLTVETATEEDWGRMSSIHLKAFRELFPAHQSLARIHRVNPVALRAVSTGVLKGVAITQNAPAEFTAINIFSWTWIFPAAGVVIDPEFVGALRSVPEIGNTGLQIVLQAQGAFSLDSLAEPTIPPFWALTPRSQFGALRRSFEKAFSSLLDRYSAEELESLISREAVSDR